MMTLEEMKNTVEELLPSISEYDPRLLSFIEYLIVFYLKADLDIDRKNQFFELTMEYLKNSISTTIARISTAYKIDMSCYFDILLKEEIMTDLSVQEGVLSSFNLEVDSYNELGQIYFYCAEHCVYFSFCFGDLVEINTKRHVRIEDKYEHYRWNGSKRVFETIDLTCEISELNRTLRKVELIRLHRQYERLVKEQQELLDVIKSKEMQI